ncbi:MAG: phenylalanine--tRNA ligase subunit beta [Magnetococcales bacterium]|nr:phenylalanine--tRNA ligase subunit beta [Magnetococcales bacterium]
MKLTWRWLQEHVTTTLTAREAADRLTMAGFEVESLTDMGRSLAGVRTGVLESVIPHPQADRLTVCQVKMGAERLEIVCGARNHRSGDVVAVALPGSQLANGLTIAVTTIRGQRSAGMLCSLQELGLAESAEGVLILPPGTEDDRPLATVLGYDDELFEINVTPNRGDCLGVRGIARELAAVSAGHLMPLTVDLACSSQAGPINVKLGEDSACYRYAGRIVSGVSVAPSPTWLIRRLEAVGLRAINNVVDATNYVMIELGQPLHAFDLAKIQGSIVVRGATDGERLTALNGVEYPLTSTMSVIADDRGPLALAGIMGGADSAVEGNTVDLFLESAWFEPVAIAKTGRKLGLNSDSRYRFERGTDPDGVRTALDRVTQLVLQLAGGTAGGLVWAERPLPQPPLPIPFRPQRVNRLGGLNIPVAEMVAHLTALGCHYRSEFGQVTPPSWRHDLRCEEDLVEEVIRLHGYDHVPVVMPEAVMVASAVDAMSQLIGSLRRLLVANGYLETVNYVFVSPDEQRRFTPEQPAVALLNPLSEEQSLLRTSLIPGLVATAVRNLKRGNTPLRLFEQGRVFLPNGQGGVNERERLAGLLCGAMQQRSWYAPERLADFFDIKGDAMALLSALAIDAVDFQVGGPSCLHPGRRAVCEVGWMGQLHPSLQTELDIDHPLFLFEFDCQQFIERQQSGCDQKRPPISPFPSVSRDLALVLPETVPAQAVIDVIQQQRQPLIRHIDLFDVYVGAAVAAGHKSLGVALVMQSDDHTLTEQECQGTIDAVVQSLQQGLGATLRGPSR